MLYYNKARDFVTGMANATTVPKQSERGASFYVAAEYTPGLLAKFTQHKASIR